MNKLQLGSFVFLKRRFFFYRTKEDYLSTK
jgi:hypothetical protein